MNATGNFTADTTGATWEQPSDEQIREEQERSLKVWRAAYDKWRRANGISETPGWFERLIARLCR